MLVQVNSIIDWKPHWVLFVTLKDLAAESTQLESHNIYHYFIQEHIEYQEIKLNYISTKNILANVFIKALPCKTFEKFRSFLGVLLSD